MDESGNGDANSTDDAEYMKKDVHLRGVFKPWIIIVGLLIVAGYQWHTINFTWDDPFITWRYAENLANGDGLVFNIGERVEGYSNLLYVLIFALFYKVHIYWGELRLLYPAKILGCITSLALIWLTIRYAAKLDSFRRLNFPKAAVIIGFIAVSNVFLHIWAMCGMETILFPFLVILANLVLLNAIESSGSRRRRLFITSGLLFFLVSITRADGFVMVAASLLFIMLTIRGKKMTLREGMFVFLAWVIPSLIVLAWRYSYYGDIFPMSYYSKATGGWDKIRAGGYQWWFGAGQVVGHIVVYAVIYLPVFLRKGKVGTAYFLLFIQAIIYQLYIIYSGFDFLWANRFFTHMLPVLELMLFAGICELMLLDRSFRCDTPNWLSYESSRRNAVILLIAILGVFGVTGNIGMYTLQHWLFPSGYLTGTHPDWMLKNYYNAGMWMKENLEPADRVAIGDIGAIPYISGVQVLDTFGLVDEYIAKLPGNFFYEQYDINYILGDKPGINETPPDYVVLMGHLRRKGSERLLYQNYAPDKFHYMTALWNDPRFLLRYELVAEIDNFLVFKRKDLGRGPEPTDEMRRWFEKAD